MKIRKDYGSELPVYASVGPKAMSVYAENAELRPGQVIELEVGYSPSNAKGGVDFESSDPMCARVDEYGRVTGIKKGTATIYATACNGVKSTVKIKVVGEQAELTYKKLSDGSGYRVVGCDEDAYMVTIPAEYKGLPVKEVDGKAFTGCANLRMFMVDAASEYFYEEDGVLFSTEPVKTLVRVPCNYADEFRGVLSYTVPKGVKAIADYAFAGIRGLRYVHIPKGVSAMGSYVFSESHARVNVFVPDSLTDIGENLVLNHYETISFLCSEGSAFDEYADKNNLICGYITKGTVHETSVHVIDSEALSGAKTADIPKHKTVEISPESWYTSISVLDDVYWIQKQVDLSDYQSDANTEVKVIFEDEWQVLIPNRYNERNSKFPAMTGVYGAGCTEGEATLIGYDLDGSVVGVLEINGDFAFAFEGAVNIGVLGGKNTCITALPYEPTYVSSTGSISLDPEAWNLYASGVGFRYFVFCYNNAEISFEAPISVNAYSYGKSNVCGSGGNMSAEDSYSVLLVFFKDESNLSQTDKITITCDGAKTVFENDEFECQVNKSYDLDAQFGKHAYELLTRTKSTMSGTYFPSSTDVNKITLMINGRYPMSAASYISCDEETAHTDEVLIHEMVHAIDKNVTGFLYQPIAWYEGRAEYITDKVLNEKTKPDKCDWNFLNAEYKNDFFDYFYFHQDRNSPYTVGYYFIKYISEKHGEDVSGRIMEKLDAINSSTGDPAELAEVFKKCVTSCTSDTVFQDFVTDVINK